MKTPFKLVQAGTLFAGTKRSPLPMLLRDYTHGGVGRIVGTVKEKGTPVDVPLRRRVVLIAESTRQVVREMWSDAATGGYEFRGLNVGLTFTVLSYDHTGAFRAVVASGITPELIP